MSFDGSSSGDPEEQALTYLWDFGDGSTDTTSTATTSHAYTVNGTYTASLVVRDPTNLQSTPATVTIVVGNAPPTPVITAPADGSSFSVGQTITLSGYATDLEDGSMPAGSLVWNVWRFHRDHRHPYFGPASGTGLTITGPPPEDLVAATNSYLIVELTATDSKGATTTVSRIVRPQAVWLSFATVPSGLNLVVKNVTFTAPFSVLSWVGWQIPIQAPSPQGPYRFLTWSDHGTATHTITTTASPTTYTARYVKVAR